MIQLKNFSVNNFYQDVNVTFDSELTCLLGANGSGKSLLTHFLIGLYNNYSGEIKFDAVLLTDNNYFDIQQQVKLLTHNPENQFLGYSVYDEVSFKLFQKGFSKNEINSVFRDFFCDFDPNEPISSLSHLRRLKLLVLSLICTGERFLIIDEGLSLCDDKFKLEIFTLLKQHGVKVLYITNNVYDARFANKCFCLKDKKIIPFLPKLDLDITHTQNLLGDIVLVDGLGYKFNIKSGLNVAADLNNELLLKLADLSNNRNLVRSNVVSIGLVSSFGLNQICHVYVSELLFSSHRGERAVLQMLELFDFDLAILDRELNSLSTGQLIIMLIIYQVLVKRDLIILEHVIEVLDFEKQQILLDFFVSNQTNLLIISHNLLIFNKYSYHLIGGDLNV